MRIMNIILAFPESTIQPCNASLKGLLVEIHLSHTSNMTNYINLNKTSMDDEQSATALSANEIVKDFIMNRSPEFRKLDELRSLVRS